MRLRTILTLSSGAALGASAMYLLDPDHGEQRRRDARRSALRQTREQGRRVLVEGTRQAAELAGAARTGYHQARDDAASMSTMRD